MHIPEISVIVPVYKTEKYLEACVRSILAQTFADIELILVDDGSPDRCGELCDGYAEKDRRVRAIHQENRGVSAARNAGIEAAQGKFITFIDSDDCVAPDMLEMLRQMLVRSDADAAVCGVRECGTGSAQSLGPDVPLQTLVFQTIDARETIRRILLSELAPYCCAILYRASLFPNVRFPEGKTYAEDTYVTIRLLAKASKICVTEQEKYHYVRHEESITTSAYSTKLLSTIELWGKSVAFIKEVYPSLSLQAERMYILSHFDILNKMLASSSVVDPQEKQFVVNGILSRTWEIIKNPYLGKGCKLSCLCLLAHEDLYKSCTHLLPKIKTRFSGG